MLNNVYSYIKTDTCYKWLKFPFELAAKTFFLYPFIFRLKADSSTSKKFEIPRDYRFSHKQAILKKYYIQYWSIHRKNSLSVLGVYGMWIKILLNISINHFNTRPDHNKQVLRKTNSRAFHFRNIENCSFFVSVSVKWTVLCPVMKSR